MVNLMLSGLILRGIFATDNLDVVNLIGLLFAFRGAVINPYVVRFVGSITHQSANDVLGRGAMLNRSRTSIQAYIISLLSFLVCSTVFTYRSLGHDVVEYRRHAYGLSWLADLQPLPGDLHLGRVQLVAVRRRAVSLRPPRAATFLAKTGTISCRHHRRQLRHCKNPFLTEPTRPEGIATLESTVV